MTGKAFDQRSVDVQATSADPVTPEAFDFEAYSDYEASLLDRCRDFWQADSGVLVHRRMRIAEVFSHGCRDMKASLEWQLGGLKKSMEFKADVPNFLTPWYGIGPVASAFGVDYIWKEGQAPAVRPPLKNVREALDYPAVAVSESAIGCGAIEMIDYFLDKTGGRVPMSLTDTQSPLNIAGNVVEMSSFFLEMFDDPKTVKAFLMKLAELLAEFTRDQIERIGQSIVWPGHGYASCRSFEGLGMSNDNALMISGDQYIEFAGPAFELLAGSFAGAAFHSCGDWSGRADKIRTMRGLRMVDGAFSAATDPTPNRPESFAEAFANTGIVVNARIVGDCETITETVRKLWRSGMKLIVVTYCQAPEEQAEAYDQVHEICA